MAVRDSDHHSVYPREAMDAIDLGMLPLPAVVE